MAQVHILPHGGLAKFSEAIAVKLKGPSYPSRSNVWHCPWSGLEGLVFVGRDV